MTPTILTRRTVVQSLVAFAVPVATRGAEKGAIEAPVIVEDGRLWISVQMGDRSLRFIIDTGAAGNFIRPEIAKELGLRNVSAGGSVGGVGGKSRVVGAVEASAVVVGGVVRQNGMTFSTYDFDRGLPQDAAGLLAAGVVTAYDCDLTLGETVGQWRIWPGGRSGAPEGMPMPGAMINHRNARDSSERIIVTATIDEKPYRMLVDTGSPRALTLFSRASARSGLWDAPSWAPQQISGFGGAASRLSRITRAARLELGPLALKRPFVTLVDPAQAAFGDVDGLIGLPLISLFDLSLDASAGKVWARRNARKPTADGYLRSGLWVRRDTGGNAVVAAVGAGSPAGAAGVLVGDRISGPFVDAMRAINGGAGKTIELDLIRNGAPVKTRFVLSDYL